MTVVCWILLLLISVWPVASTAVRQPLVVPPPPPPSVSGGGGSSSCEPITVPICREMPYNYTRLPNLIGDHDQRSVAFSMKDFELLIDIKCSVHLKFFLCSVFTPMCTEAMDEPITSCRSVCQEVERSCSPPLASFGIHWPALLNCSQFPVQNSEPPCMDPSPARHNQANAAAAAFADESQQSLDIAAAAADLWPAAGATGVGYAALPSTDRPNAADPQQQQPGATAVCRSQQFFVYTDRHGLHDRCLLRCGQNWLYSSQQRWTVRVWMTCWSAVCLLATGLTLVTFLLDGRRFSYPKRPIVFIAFCQFLSAVAYMMPTLVGSQRLGCETLASGDLVHVAHTLNNAWCVVNFVLQYYSALANIICWLILTITWYLAAARKWSQEAIGRLNGTFHMFAWAVPAVLTVVVMVTNEVQSNELTNLCFVCSKGRLPLYAFYVGPVSVVLVVGMAFMGIGMYSTQAISRDMRSRACDADLNKSRQLMTKMGTYSLLYIFVTVIAVICAAYEKLHADYWDAASSCWPPNAVANDSSTDDLWPGRQLGCAAAAELSDWARPTAQICMLRIAMNMLIGIVGCLWVCTGKTVQTWRRCISRPCWKSAGSKPLVQYTSGCAAQHHVGRAPAAAAVSPNADATGPSSQTPLPTHCYFFPSKQPQAKAALSRPSKR